MHRSVRRGLFLLVVEELMEHPHEFPVVLPERQPGDRDDRDHQVVHEDWDPAIA